jgi:hypothetical protein
MFGCELSSAEDVRHATEPHMDQCECDNEDQQPLFERTHLLKNHKTLLPEAEAIKTENAELNPKNPCMNACHRVETTGFGSHARHS